MSAETLSRPLSDRVADLPVTPTLDDTPKALPQAVIDAAVQAFADGKTHYTDRPGIKPLREWVTDQLRDRYEVDLSPDAVTITCGATEARYVSLTQLVAGGAIYCAGDNAIISAVAQLVNVPIVTTPETATVAYLTPADGPEAVGQIRDQLAAGDLWLVWDMSHATAAHYHPAQDEAIAGRVVTIGGLDDSLPGWRIGWMAGSEKANQLRAYKQSMTICSTSISQWAALGLVETE